MGQRELRQGFPGVEGAMPGLHGADGAVPELPLRGEAAEIGLF